MSPEKLKLILIDPKQLELALYQDLPHLLLPVMTESKNAAMSLLWACQEMERRYSILKEMGVRNIDAFNQKVNRVDNHQLEKISQHYSDDVDSYELPYIVIIVDEFADLILTKMGKDIEINICRLAAKARAAGIHLVLATQRPSVDVITGLIKANFPTRVSFRVTSPIDSRTILNAQGAEMLLGMGDMLYKHGVEMMRLHSGYVDEEEIENLVEKLGEIPTDFSEEALEFIENDGQIDEDKLPEGIALSNTIAQTGDELYDRAVEVVMEYRQASASMLQRRLRIGYNRAANLIDQLEEAGIVGPAQGSKPREILGGE
jgi:S-DNA-T family DNA segregation ATPase FtsK/SpoIIIE